MPPVASAAVGRSAPRRHPGLRFSSRGLCAAHERTDDDDVRIVLPGITTLRAACPLHPHRRARRCETSRRRGQPSRSWRPPTSTRAARFCRILSSMGRCMVWRPCSVKLRRSSVCLEGDCMQSKAHGNEHGPDFAHCPTACSAAAAPRGLRPAVRMPTTARPQQPAGVRRRRGDFDVRYTVGGAKSGEARRPAPAEFGGGEAGGGRGTKPSTPG